MRTTVELTSLFRERGLKVTPQRELVFRLLQGNVTHPTAEAVYSSALEVMPMISLKTVYQVLNDLRALGEIQSIEVGTGALRFDPNTTDHHHLVCQGCADVRDVHVDTSELSLSRAQRSGFSLEGVDVTFRGLCASCRSSSKSKSNAKP
jgi:Fe2+ or Zn2+ uptake regulation protein